MAEIIRSITRKVGMWKPISFAVSRRQVFSASYTQPECVTKYTEQRKKDIAGKSLSSICLLIDRCSEKNLPYSSLTIDDMVHAIEDRDDILSSMYYLHKFRHSDMGYFLRPWTTYFWVRKCIELGANDLALKALNERSQYGIFPESFSFSLLIHDALKENDYDLAFKFASYTFVMESIDDRACQISCLLVILNLMKTHDSVSPEFLSVVERRNFSGLCLHLGLLLGIKSLKTLGYAGLGALENEHGIRSVYQDPWGPLMWTNGYLEKAVAEIGIGNTLLHRDVLNYLSALVSNEEQLSRSLSKLVSSSESAGLVCEEPLQKSLSEQFLSQVPDAETSAISSLTHKFNSWVDERQQLVDVGKRIAEEQALERKEYLRDLNLTKHAKKMAVERLGYWEFLTENVELENLELHLKEGYVTGSSSDIDIERRIDSIGS